jgi:hypothetical protein
VELFEEWRDKPNMFVVGLDPGHDCSLAVAHLHEDHHATSSTAKPTPMAKAVK